MGGTQGVSAAASRSLGRQLVWRLAASLLVTMLLTVGAAAWVAGEAARRVGAAQQSDALAHFSNRIRELEEHWQVEIARLRSRIEFSRILEDPDRWQARAIAFLTSESGLGEFSRVLILSPDGRVLLHHPSEGASVPPPEPARSDSGFVWSAAEETVFRTLRGPVWIGGIGMGQLVVYRPLDHALLGQHAYPETDVFLLWADRPVASSAGSAGLKEAARRLVEGERGGRLTDGVDWGGPAEKGFPRLVVSRQPRDRMGARELVLPAVLGSAVFALAAWFALGGWMRGNLRRLERLGEATATFARDRMVSASALSLLEAARAGREDELSSMSDAVERLMTDIVQHETSRVAAELALRDSEERYRFLVEGTQVIAWEYDLARDRFTYVSPRAESILGYPVREWQRPGFFEAHVHPDDRDRVLESCAKCRKLKSDTSFDYRMVRADGRPVWVHDITSIVRLPSGEPTSLRGILVDISERKNIEERLAVAGQVFDIANEGIMVTDAANRIISVNPAFETITGYPASEAIGRDPAFLASGTEDPAVWREAARAIRERGGWEGEFSNRRRNGEYYVQRTSISTVRDAAGKVFLHVALLSDITLQKRQAEAIEHQAGHDMLTGLPNRRLLSDRLAQAIARARRDGRQLGLLLLDLDGFKHVNDTLGHAHGDLLLVDAANRLQACVRQTDTIARLGGDEFVLLISDVASQSDLQGVAAKVHDALELPFDLAGQRVHVSSSIGITVFPGDGQTPEELLRNADTAMYQVKAEGKSSFRFFTPQMQAKARARMQIEADMRRGIANDEFELYYQPIVDLASGRLVKAEALLRWNHPERGLVQPGEFVPLAEETGLIVPLGNWVVLEASRRARDWEPLAPAGFRVCANLSAHQFRRRGGLRALHEAVSASGGSPLGLVAEITESVFLSDEVEAAGQLEEMRALGVQIAIDDFGTGYSSLAYLMKLSIDILKIDRSFVQGIPDNPESMALIEAILSICRSLSIEPVAEGVETRAQAAFLRARGCRHAQGYLFGRPVPATLFERQHLRTRQLARS